MKKFLELLDDKFIGYADPDSFVCFVDTKDTALAQETHDLLRVFSLTELDDGLLSESTERDDRFGSVGRDDIEHTAEMRVENNLLYYTENKPKIYSQFEHRKSWLYFVIVYKIFICLGDLDIWKKK